MKSNKNNRRSLFYSVISLLLCISMLLGTTLAWFSDSVSSTGNIIKTGRLKVAMHYADDLSGEWKDASEATIFNGNYWEPGFSDMKYIKVSNTGNLAFSYQMHILPAVQAAAGDVNLADVIDVYVGVVDADFTAPAAFSTDMPGLSKMGTLAEVMAAEPMTGILLPEKGASGVLPEGVTADTGDVTYCVVLHMQETAGNEYQNLTVGNNFTIQLVAAQYSYEQDNFGGSYDAGSEYPDLKFPEMMDMDMGSAEISVDSENKLTQAVTLKGTAISANVPVGVLVKEGTTKLTLTVEVMDDTTSNITLGEGEEMRSLNVHVSGVSEENTVPMIISLGEVAPEYLNQGNLNLAHVENGVTVPMTRVEDPAELDAHNEYYYDVLTGELTVAMATFSEVAVVADMPNAWNGEFDYSWYTGVQARTNDVDYKIANADQLAAFGAIVGGMAEDIEQDSFTGKTVKLLADIDLGDKNNANESLIFHPIGYYYTDDKNADGTTGDYYSTVNSFEGTFDGNGHTIKNFYQNTWEIKGDYDANYYKDGMGLFGYVVNGKVCNLTVDNFSSDGEFTPTGVIAAYAVNSTFENIAITNCNPRVYNTGNGGIVGIGGNDDDPDAYKLTFNNITIDNSNVISALWGSWDVACGGLVGMFRGDGHVHMTNCHVAAQIDVYNDVCGNYQYYWYRYSGMMVGTNKNMVTDDAGYTVPETSKYHATGCTVHFGDWNDYYYCELVDNTLASYTHDHQMSRLTEVKAVNDTTITYLDGTTGTVPTSGRANYVVVNGDEGTENATCYHFKDGAVWTHDMGGAETSVDVNGDGIIDEKDIKEDKQHIYLPFNQLFTGYGWGVKHVPIYDDGTPNPFAGVTILKRDYAETDDKFEKNGNYTKFATGDTVTLGQLFTDVAPDNNQIVDGSVQVFVSPVEENGTAGGTYVPNTTDWTLGTLQFSGVGAATISITDYQYCRTLTVDIEIVDKVAKFEAAFDHDSTKDGNQNYIDTYLYRVGNNPDTPVKLESLFETIDGASVDSASVTVDIVGSNAGGAYDGNTSDWTQGTIKFTGTGPVAVTIKDAYSTAYTLNLEVVNAKNATSAASATANNVVLLNNCDFSTITVSNGYTLYGNGFTMTNKSDVLYHSLTVGFVTLDNGTLDNVQVVVPNFSHAVLYNSNMTEISNYYDSNSEKYGNVRSAVMSSGNSQILNSYVSGGRAAVYVIGGNAVIDNATIVGGAAANIHVTASATGLTLRDATLIQVPTQATVHDTSKTLMGLSVLMMCDDKYGAQINLDGYLNQYAWAHEGYKTYVPSAGQSFVTTVLNEKDYIHQITYSDGKTYDSLNLGFAFLPTGTTAPADPVVGGMINDDRTDGKTYGAVDINGAAYVYSYKNSNGTSADVTTKPDYDSNAQDAVLPTVTFTDANENRIFKTEYDATNGWMSTLTVDVDAGNYDFSFDNLVVQKYGQSLNYTVATADGTAIDKTKVVTLSDSSTTEYVLAITDNLIYDQNGDLTNNTVEREYTFKLLSTKTSLPAPTWVSTELTGTALRVGESKSTTDWNVALPVLEGLKVKYYSKAQGREVELALADVPLGDAGKKSDTNTYTLTVENEYTLTVTTTGFHSTDDGKPTVSPNPTTENNTLYFTSSTYVSSSTSERAIVIKYSFTDANNSPTLTHNTTWTVQYTDIQNSTRYDPEKMFEGETREPCVTPDTLITLADGSQVRVDSLTGNEELLVWNLETGKLDSAPILFVDSDPEAEFEIIHLYFSDGTDVKVISEHGFWDYDLNKYVYLDRYADKYIGHTFAKQNGSELTKVQLTDVVLETEVTTAWSPVTAGHLCYFVNGMLSMPGGVGGLFNIFEVDPETMTYDPEAMQRDIEKYGLFTYEEMNGIVPLPEEMFEAAGGAYLKVSIGKGNMTMDDLIYMIERYTKFFG